VIERERVSGTRPVPGWIFEELFSTDLSLSMALVIRHDGILVAIAALTLASFTSGLAGASTQQACPRTNRAQRPGRDPRIPRALPPRPQATIDDRWQ